jgi:hypothetical protein
MLSLSLALLSLELVGAASSPNLAVVTSLDPVLPNETAVSIIPGLVEPANATIEISGRNISPLRVAPGIVHWILPADLQLDEYNYTICNKNSAKCSPATRLNAAQLWWKQCVGLTAKAATSASPTLNGLACSPGISVLRIFGKGLSYDGGRCSSYHPYAAAVPSPRADTCTQLRLMSTSGTVVLEAETQSCYDATFALPASLAPGSYTIELKSNLPSASWTAARDPDQRILKVLDKEHAHSGVHYACAPEATPPIVAKDRTELFAAINTARTRKGGASVQITGGAILMRDTDTLVIPECVVLHGAGVGKTRLIWPDLTAHCPNHGQNKPLIGPDPAGAGVATVSDFSIVAVPVKGCGAVVGVTSGTGFTLRRMNISMLGDMRTPYVFASLIQVSNANNFLIEDSSFLHCGNNAPGDAHAGVNSPIFSVASSSDGVVRNNLWQVGLSGWHLDKSWHIDMESNTYTGYFDNDMKRPLPNFDGSFWFSSYGQGPFPGAGRFFYANTTQNERAHTKPQVGGGESFTLDGGNDGGYFGAIASIQNGTSFTVAGDVCWRHVGGYSPDNCSTAPAVPGGKTGHAAVVLEGTGKGQWRRVIGSEGYRNRAITVDAPFDPPVSLDSRIEIGQMRGQLLIVGNNFVKGGSTQLYAACYDCVVAENHFEDFGFSNWGRNPHGAGWQPNINNIMVDNMLARNGFAIRGCSATCSDPRGLHCTRPSPNSHSHGQTCSGNATSLPGRDCAPYAKDSYRGAINLQLAWRRNKITQLTLNLTDIRDIPLLDGGLVEHNIWGLPAGHATNTSATANVLVREV